MTRSKWSSQVLWPAAATIGSSLNNVPRRKRALGGAGGFGGERASSSRPADDWSSFVGAPGLTSDLLRLAARKAGVHLYTQTECNVYANGPFVALHAAQDGPITLDTGRPGQVHDALSGDLLGKGPHLILPLKKGETRVLRR